MNGLGVLPRWIRRQSGIGPAFAGLLFLESAGRIVPPLGPVVVWTIVACMGLGFFVQTLLLPEHVVDTGATSMAKMVMMIDHHHFNERLNTCGNLIIVSPWSKRSYML